MVMPRGPLAPLPDTFVDVFATRIAEYSGRDRGEVRVALQHAGDELPARVADLMFDNVRRHLGDETETERAAAERRAELNREQEQFVNGLDPRVATRVLTLAADRGSPPPERGAAELRARQVRELDELIGELDPETGRRVRELVASSGPPSQTTIRDDYVSAHRRLTQQLTDDLSRVAKGAGGGLVTSQRARAEAEGVFAVAVDLTHPVALRAGEPRAVAAEPSARIDSALRSLSGQPADFALGPEGVQGWLTRADKVAATIRNDPEARDGALREFGATVTTQLQRAAGDTRTQHGAGQSAPEADATLRDGLAIAWAQKSARVLFERLPLPPELDGVADVALPDRWEGRMATGLVRSLAERTGASEAAVLDTLTSAAGRDPYRSSAWTEAGRLLLPDDHAARLASGRGSGPGQLQSDVTDAMRWAYESQHRGDLQRDPAWQRREEPGLPVEQIGSAAAAAGAKVVDDLERVTGDTALGATFNAARLPEVTGGQFNADSAGQRPERPGGHTPRRDPGGQVR